MSSGSSTNNVTADNVVLNFNIDPFKTGLNIFELNFHKVNGTAIENIRNVFLEFENSDKNLGPLINSLNKLEIANYPSTGNYLSQKGKWEIKIIVQRIDE